MGTRETIVGDLLAKVGSDVSRTAFCSVMLLDDHEERFVIAVGAVAGALGCAAAVYDKWKPGSTRTEILDAVISAVRDIMIPAALAEPPR